MTLAALLISTLLLSGCATPARRAVVPMRCDAEAADGIDCKILEFNCRNSGKTWTGTACR